MNRTEEYVHQSRFGTEWVIHRDWLDRIGGEEGLLRYFDVSTGKVLRAGGGQGVTRQLDIAGETTFPKTYRADRWSRKIREFAGDFRTIREWRANCRAMAAGIPCAGVVAAIGVRRGFRVEQLIISLAAPGEELTDYLARIKGDETRLNPFLEVLAAFVADLHEKGFFHMHLSCKHIFRAEGDQFTLIDLDGSFIKRPMSNSYAHKNIDKVTRSLRRNLEEAQVAFFASALARELDKRGCLPPDMKIPQR